MPSGRSLFKRIQQLLDGPGALGSGDNGKTITWNSATGKFVATSLPAAVTPGGSTTQVQYNNAGAFAGDAGMTYDAANDALSLVGRLVVPVIRPPSDGAAALKIKTAADADFITVDTANRRWIINGGLGVAPTSHAPLEIQIDGAGNGFVISYTSTEYTKFVSGGVAKGMQGFGSVPFKIANDGDVFIVAGIASERFRGSSVGLSFNGVTPVARPSITGSRSGNAALADLLTKLASTGLITDGTSA